MSGKTNDGGPAFPISHYNGDEVVTYSGMSLRDYFAGQALVASTPLEGDCTPSEIASDCYNWADAMLDERKRRQG